MQGRRQLEAMLEARGLGATLRPCAGAGAGGAGAEVNDGAGLARLLLSGPPRGAITELVGGGLTSLAVRLAAGVASGNRDARLAWLDPADAWDPDSARHAGVRLEQVLWMRGEGGGWRGLSLLSRWHRALHLLVAAGGMDLIVADFSTWPLAELRRTPRAAWFRLLRGLERTRQTALVVLAPAPLASTSAALVVELSLAEARFAPGWARLEGIDLEGRLLRGPVPPPRRPATSEGRLPLELPA